MPPPNKTHLYDLPDVILSNIFHLITDVRSRNSASLVSRKFLLLERSTRTSLTLRGNHRQLFLVPSSFRSVTHLDLSLLSPWGHSLFDDYSSSSHHDSRFLALLLSHLSQIFPSVHSLTLYARTPDTLCLLAPCWPHLRRVKLVRWHQRSPSPLGSDFISLFQHCNSLESLDLSHFYCWTEDLPPALQAHPSVSASISHLDLLTLSSAEGFKSQELIAITGSCPNLRKLLAACMFDPRYIDFVGDEAVLAVAANCPRLELLHLADTSSLSNLRGDPEDDGFSSEDARIGRGTLEDLFSGLPFLQELVLDVYHNVRDSGSVLELLNFKCPRLKSLKLGHFHGICRGVTSQLDGIALCKRLECLSIKNCGDLTDNVLMAIALGCPRISKFEVRGCKKITEMGMRNLTCVLSKTLVDVKISCCKNLDAAGALRALEPIRHRIQRLHIDCVWGRINKFDLNNEVEVEEEQEEENEFNKEMFPIASKRNKPSNFNETNRNKRLRISSEQTDNSSSNSSNGSEIQLKTWDRLQYLSLWSAVGELLTPLHLIGLENCPVLEEVRIRIEGDCRGRPRPSDDAFGLSCLSRYPRLSKMQLDCRDAVGYSLTAPPGHMDLSLWDRFYLKGIGDLSLNELDYWPAQDREVNQRSLSLPAAGLLSECTALRKLFIHGTAHEHFMMMLLKIPNLRDVQLREDYYPAPEDDMSTEMRATSCCRFEDALNRRNIPD